MLELLSERQAKRGDRPAFYRKHQAALEKLRIPAPSKVAEQTLDTDFLKQAEQRDHFDAFAGGDYRITYEEFENLPFWRALDALVFDAWRPLLPEGGWLLDVGCGNGRSAFKILDRNIRLVGFDISAKLVRQAIARAQRTGVLHKATFFVADANRFPFRDRLFDCALIYGALHHLPDPALAVRETARVLKTGGRYLGNENNTTPLRDFFDWMMRRRTLWVEKAGSNPLIGRDDLFRWAQGTGLQLSIRSSVVVPPHLCNLLGERVSKILLRWTDGICHSLPPLRRIGGLLLIEGIKTDPIAGVSLGK